MELDQEKQRRVWARVQGNQTMPPLAGDSVGRMELLARENGAALMGLSRQKNVRHGDQLRKLAQEQHRLADAVRGIGYLRGEAPGRQPAFGGKENPRRTLAECLGRCMEFQLECVRRTADPDYGPIFAALARQSADQAAVMAEVLGEMEK